MNAVRSRKRLVPLPRKLLAELREEMNDDVRRARHRRIRMVEKANLLSRIGEALVRAGVYPDAATFWARADWKYGSPDLGVEVFRDGRPVRLEGRPILLVASEALGVKLKGHSVENPWVCSRPGGKQVASVTARAVCGEALPDAPDPAVAAECCRWGVKLSYKRDIPIPDGADLSEGVPIGAGPCKVKKIVQTTTTYAVVCDKPKAD